MEGKQEGKQEENKKVKLFREKTLELAESPEALNEYLQVTSPGVWLVLASVIVLLTGLLVWAIFGRITTTVKLAVSATEETTVCYIPYQQLEAVMKAGKVTVEDQKIPLQKDPSAEMYTVTEDTNPYLRVAGDLEAGTVTVVAQLEAKLSPGVYSGTAETESLQPLALLMD